MKRCGSYGDTMKAERGSYGGGLRSAGNSPTARMLDGKEARWQHA